MAVALDRYRWAPDQTMMGQWAARLAIRQLKLTDFRSYPALRLTVDPRPVVLTGANGAGKTNLLEAISFLTPGRGLRRAKLAEADRAGAGPWAVAAQVDTPRGLVDLGTGRIHEGARERRAVHVDGTPASSQTALAEVVSAIWLTPAMDRLFQDGANARRRFLDHLVLADDSAHAGRVSGYGHALRERTRLLRSGRADATWLGALENRAALAGVAIAAARRHMVDSLNRVLADDQGSLPRPELALAGPVEGWLDDLSALDAETRLAELLAASRREDAETGTTAMGPHRSDLVVRDLITGRLAKDCSTGQQKALLVSTVLAQVRLRAARGDPLPLVLLDEVVAHLDAERRSALFEALCALGAQAWLTGTDAAVFAPLGVRAQFFLVRNSNLQRHDPI